ncbi:MAG: hypothetical protein H7A25_09085 [Leptospiraceae bacterium]|nr:hypothetical protein [Leptospiraceae bacterium]MCP5500044.1 hypothetical protein [Leptospiraceae bacterium]
MEEFKIDPAFLLRFENQLNPAFPEKSSIPVKILGYGEISSTFKIEGIDNYACKRMPPFSSSTDIEAYCNCINEYCEHLRNAGVKVLPYKLISFQNKDAEWIVYIVQPLLKLELIGNTLFHNLRDDELKVVYEKLLKNLQSLYVYNSLHEEQIQLGLDGQISNWYFPEDNSMPLYFDISTPLYRKNNKEQLNVEVFLKSMPSLIALAAKYFFLQDVLDRYYDLRMVIIDILGNLYKEGLQEKIPNLLSLSNDFFLSLPSNFQVLPLVKKEVHDYYKEDKFIWGFLLFFRKVDRFISTKILRKQYNFILPGKIKR